MRKLGLSLAVLLVSTAVAQPVLFQVDEMSIVVDYPSPFWTSLVGEVRYQKTLSTGEERWTPSRAYTGIPLWPVIRALGGMDEDDLVWVIADDGYAVALPSAVVKGATPLGTPIIAYLRDGIGAPEWEGAPQLVFLAPDGEVSNEDQLSALGEHAHFRGGRPSATGLMVKGVKWVVLNWDGDLASLPRVGEWSADARLTVSIQGEEHTYTLAELEETFASVTYPGTYVTSVGSVVTHRYTGVPVTDLIGAWPPDTQIELVAADDYRMRYRYGELEDQEGVWILAFKCDGAYMPFDPGYFRMVKVGPTAPQFEGALSARMVVRIEVQGEYRDYSLRLSGTVQRTFSRRELEAGVGCPCHASTVTVTRKGEAHAYTGLPLWRLLAYVDDERYPAPEKGIHYDDADFDFAAARRGYTIVIVAQDGYVQRIPSTYVAGDDRYIIALKRDGRFLEPEEGGPLMFVWDDSAPVPEGLRRVKWVTEIRLELTD